MLVGGGVGEEEAHLNVFEEEELQIGRRQSDPSRGIDGDGRPRDLVNLIMILMLRHFCARV